MFQILNRNEKGFTLLEVLLAILILGLIVASLAPVLVFSAQSSEYSRAKIAALNLANKKMEEIRALPFNEIGTEGGNPAGNIPFAETVTVGKYTFKVETFINWIEEGGCLSGNNADWDYKQVRIRVTALRGFFQQNKQPLKVEISSLIARDAEQPALTGANLRVCVFRIWGAGFNPDTGEFDVNFIKPVSSVKVLASQGGSTTQVYTTSKGSALFLGMPAGTYQVDVDPSLVGMIVFPGSYPQNNITITDNSTRQLFAWVEIPCRLQLFFKDIYENPLSLNLTEKARLTLIHPHPAGYRQSWEFTSSSASGELLGHPFKDLWPVGEGFTGKYSWDRAEIKIPGYVLSGRNGENGAYDQDRNEPWGGEFSRPGTVKRLTFYLVKLFFPENPVLPAGWTEDNEIRENPDNKGIAFIEVIIDPEADPPSKMYLIQPAVFRTNNGDELILSSGSPQYTAAEFLFNNQKLTISSNAELKLKGNIITFLSAIELRKEGQDASGKITFNAITGNIHYNGSYVSITDPSGNLLIKEAPDGSAVQDYRGYTGIPGQKYVEVYFYEDVKDSSGKIILEKGAYYLPDGFTLPDDAGKEPSAGGPLRR
ncbi:prepilin-type N-terminal cleavage/methylation domain-containing protein [Thermosyntropha lipolytica DSM 11003]|uniref:Prepilin-type N-terminal cleavage/methylation domain-containing protein n=1 Tax=Thermosyntropha lipolytica DSM 11003 TaxID=1123382 RepID=A0A1M5LNF6_9FIRM|nr:carboxypeptidase-like regulatory domain-containing protein [Thermosyntropha lipolytica]SHG66440.1 prepilin-type N-terminal cleavage/methylation domain-containing protein [Thermosyntropha lipolytica DSM 11003]